MNEKRIHAIARLDFEELAQLELNAAARGGLPPAEAQAVQRRSIALGRQLLAQRGLDLSELTPAEEKIVQAISAYVGIKKRQKSNAERTISQAINRGLIGAVEAAVEKTTAGYQALVDEDREDLQYEQIVLDHPEEFSPRALWFVRNRRGLPNSTGAPPVRSASSITQRRTENLLRWFAARSAENGGQLPGIHTNADAARAVGLNDLSKEGRVFGGIQSRIDFACYRAGLPPLGLTADVPFSKAFNAADREWSYPIAAMQSAAWSHSWHEADFERIEAETLSLPGSAHEAWKDEVAKNEAGLKAWAFGLNAAHGVQASQEAPRQRNRDWTREEMILALDLYLKNPASPAGKGSREVQELSDFLRKMAAAEGVAISDTYRNVNGVYMKMMNFRRFDPEGRSGLGAGNQEEESIWNEFYGHPEELAFAVDAIRLQAGSLGAVDETAQAVDVLRKLEAKYRAAPPRVKERVSKAIERGPVGNLVKRARGYKCQVCEAMGRHPIAFYKPGGVPYVEAHHVMPVASQETGCLAASNVMIVCANHHRQLHYGGVEVACDDRQFLLEIEGQPVSIERYFPIGILST